MLINRYTDDQLNTSQHSLDNLDWADQGLLARYRAEQPNDAEIAKVDAMQTTPTEYLTNPYLVVRALENSWAQMLATWIGAVAETVDEATALKISRAAGRVHGARMLGAFLTGRGDTEESPTQLMAQYQDTAHSMRGPRHATALFARYDDRMVEVVRTDDSTGTHGAGKQPPLMLAFLDGMVEGYRSVDPALRYVDEIVREGPDGQTETLHRFWYDT